MSECPIASPKSDRAARDAGARSLRYADASQPLARGARARLAVAGCGDDDESGGGTAGESAPRLSKAEFIEQADELCADFRERRDELTAKADATSDAERQAEIFRELADEAQATGERFDRLPVPAGDEEIIERYSSASRDQIGVLRQIADALDAGDTEAVRALLDSGQKSGEKVRGIAQRYGFEVCGSESA